MQPILECSLVTIYGYCLATPASPGSPSWHPNGTAKTVDIQSVEQSPGLCLALSM